MTTCLPKLLKRAWIRDESAPVGISAKGHFCDCDNPVMVDLIEDGPDVICNCGRRYSWEGYIKGRSAGSDTLTAYRVIFEDGTHYETSMAESVNLQKAYEYFVNRVIDGKLVVDVEPC